GRFAGWTIPKCMKAFDFFTYHLRGNTSARSQGRHPRDRGIEVAEVTRPRGHRGECECQESFARFFAKCDSASRFFCEPVQLKVKIWLNVLDAVLQSGQGKGP